MYRLGKPLPVDEESIEERVVEIGRVARVMEGGKRFSFHALVVVGDKKGKVGAALGKAPDASSAVRKGVEKARKNMIEVPLVGRTIPHEVVGRMGATRVIIKPAAPGTGVIAGAAVRAVLECAGIQDALTKVLGSSNPINVVWATFDGLSKLLDPKKVAELRGIPLERLSLPKWRREQLRAEREAAKAEVAQDNAEKEPHRVFGEASPDTEGAGADQTE